ncbi:MAG: serine/threonine protein kinase, partial [Myxococcales bacterium]|nr:serine/threonine protein kinase [Myxococcales bacterium]
MEPQRIGNYTVERRLGGGGVGEVYLARSRGLHGVAKQVVIKRLRGDRELNGRRVRAFLDEARLAARLSHQNICQVIELGEGDGEFFLVMEHIDGPTLAQLASGALKAAVPLPHAAAAFIVAQVCAGLSHAHDLRDGERSLDVIHRDVSPQNVLISREGEVKLIDFGIAKSALRQERTRAGIIKGKARYMSPEQARAMRVDHRTDVFSAGVVLYELLAGRRRGDGLARDELARVVREGVLDLEPLRAAAVPEALIAAVERAVATDVEARWPTAAAFGEAIEAWLRGAQAAYGRRDVAQLVQTLFPPQIEGEQGSASANKLETDRVEMEPLKIESVTHETVRERPAAQAQAQALPTAEEEAAPASARPFAPAPQAELAARGTVILP